MYNGGEIEVGTKFKTQNGVIVQITAIDENLEEYEIHFRGRWEWVDYPKIHKALQSGRLTPLTQKFSMTPVKFIT
jgi:hypothetical protein